MTHKIKDRSKGKARLRSEIVDALRGLHKIGVVGDAELEKTTLRMLGRDALPKVDAFSPSEIARLRERVGAARGRRAHHPTGDRHQRHRGRSV